MSEIGLIRLIVVWLSGLVILLSTVNLAEANNRFDKQIHHIMAQAPTLDPKALKLGLKAYLKMRKTGLIHKPVLTIIDYSKPSNEARLWVLDLNRNSVLLHGYVAHGKNSGDKFATRFSNRPRSLRSSLGFFLATTPYLGHRGYSLRLIGLEKGFNEYAKARNIVFHSAAYAGAEFARLHGRLGRSWGCFTVNQNLVNPLIQAIKQGSLVLAYYPDRHWLNHSPILGNKPFSFAYF